ncbi:MAG: type II secretion system protein, partial [Rickettsiales bacterium]
MNSLRYGFSLVELSIVLVILGLLTGGILSGQSLIRAAELRSVSTEYNRYVTAVQTFRDKYFALPGDMTNAQSFWGSSANCPGTSAQGNTDGKTCN